MDAAHDRIEAFPWPNPSLHVALVEPEIPPNTGNIARLCAATGTVLHLVGQLGFRLSDKSLKRAGLDYWDSVHMVRHNTFDAFRETVAPAQMFFFSARGRHLYTRAAYRPGDVLIFGNERTGLPADILAAHEDRVYTIPMKKEAVRSLNLATSVGIVLYEALRQSASGQL
mgnify:CR=1 FL=1